MQINLDGNLIEVIIEYKKNKNLYIRIKEDLKMYVTCNKLVSKKEIMNIIKNNEKSLLKMYNHQVKLREEEIFYYYLGKKYTLVLDESVKSAYIIDDLIVVRDRKMLEKFYHDECIKVFTERLNFWSQKYVNLPKFSLRVRKMTTRWGVCNRGNNTVTLNSELIKKELTLIDYVVVHELSHFLEANHSKNFWLEVEKRYPNYKEARKRLRG